MNSSQSSSKKQRSLSLYRYQPMVWAHHLLCTRLIEEGRDLGWRNQACPWYSTPEWTCREPAAPRTLFTSSTKAEREYHDEISLPHKVCSLSLSLFTWTNEFKAAQLIDHQISRILLELGYVRFSRKVASESPHAFSTFYRPENISDGGGGHKSIRSTW